MAAKKTFEENMSRLEEIVSLLERGDATLGDSMALFEEGTKLVNACRKELDTAEQKVVKLSKGPDDAPVEHDFAAEDYLSALFAGSAPYDRLYDAMRYSVLSGGKRIRPVLTLEFARLGGIDWHLALPYACALELVHNYSLIHDDLPCMDDDDLRRGKPTNHKVYGETLAILAGDALQPEAFRLIAQATGLPAESRIAAVEILANAAGADGMVAGQVLDTLCDVRDEAGLTQLDRLKTCAMISAAAELGCVAAGMDAEKRRQAREFGDGLGLAFQLRDDILDVTGAQEVFGKPIGSDKAEGKVTLVDVKGLEQCQRDVEQYTARAKAAIAAWPDNSFLLELADHMVNRVK